MLKKALDVLKFNLGLWGSIYLIAEAVTGGVVARILLIGTVSGTALTLAAIAIYEARDAK
jgi:hypothetical protein